VVVGSHNSSNSNRLREVAANLGVSAYLVDSANDIRPAWISDVRRVGVTAGASAPESLVNQVIDRLRQLGASRVSVLDGVSENTTFPLPKELARAVP
jgi:4-hydroxy-3-methylbut-2-enyl diphosphate reductase